MDNQDLNKLLNEKDNYIKKLLGGGFTYSIIKNIVQESENNNNPSSEENEGYKLNWTGRKYAESLINSETETILIPNNNINNLEENKNSKNSIFVGDNLQILKHLRKSYSNKIKMIYIDPPYNTGNGDFVYNDTFKWDEKELKEKLNLSDNEVKQIKNLEGKSSHSAWLSFMYPRLRIARDLLTDDGVIFISIDDNEQANLKLLCDEVFGESNFMNTIIWQRHTGGGLSKKIITGHDYILVYSMGKKVLKAPFEKNGINVVEIEGHLFYVDANPLKKEFGNKRTVGEDRYLFYEDLTKEEQIKYNTQYYTLKQWKNNKHVIYPMRTAETKNFYSITGCEGSEGIEDIMKLGFTKDTFSFPKPVKLIKKLVFSILEPDGIILDFFAGSGTTAQAVMELNKEDGGNRKFILCQLDEEINKNQEAINFCKENNLDPLISNLCIERVKRAGNILKEELKENNNLDLGFKVYECKDLEVKTINNIIDFDVNKEDLFNSYDMITPFKNEKLNSSGIDTLLTTWMFSDGFNVESKINVIKFDNVEAYNIENKLYIFKWNSEATKDLLNKLGRNELKINEIIVYMYSLETLVFIELRNNLKSSLSERSIKLIERY